MKMIANFLFWFMMTLVLLTTIMLLLLGTVYVLKVAFKELFDVNIWKVLKRQQK